MSYGNNNPAPGEPDTCIVCGYPLWYGGCLHCWQEEEFVPPMHPNFSRCKMPEFDCTDINNKNNKANERPF